MSYEKHLDDIYQARKKNWDRRDLFRQFTLNKVKVKISYTSTLGFIMPQELPNDMEDLKKLVTMNIQMMNQDPSRKAEALANIKRIKTKLIN